MSWRWWRERLREEPFGDGWVEISHRGELLGGYGPCRVCALLLGEDRPHARWECERCGGHHHEDTIALAGLALVHHARSCHG